MPGLNNGFQTQKGFTILELLLALLIVAMVSTIALASFRVGGRQIRLELEAQRVALNIRRAQALASATKRFAGCGFIKPYGYGVFFDMASSRLLYTIFADCDNTSTFTSGAGDERVEDVPLANDVQIETLSVSPLTIFFLPPQPLTKLTDDAAEASIVLALISDPATKKKVVIRRSGEITITAP